MGSRPLARRVAVVQDSHPFVLHDDLVLVSVGDDRVSRRIRQLLDLRFGRRGHEASSFLDCAERAQVHPAVSQDTSHGTDTTRVMTKPCSGLTASSTRCTGNPQSRISSTNGSARSPSGLELPYEQISSRPAGSMNRSRSRSAYSRRREGGT